MNVIWFSHRKITSLWTYWKSSLMDYLIVQFWFSHFVWITFFSSNIKKNCILKKTFFNIYQLFIRVNLNVTWVVLFFTCCFVPSAWPLHRNLNDLTGDKGRHSLLHIWAQSGIPTSTVQVPGCRRVHGSQQHCGKWNGSVVCVDTNQERLSQWLCQPKCWQLIFTLKHWNLHWKTLIILII